MLGGEPRRYAETALAWGPIAERTIDVYGKARAGTGYAVAR